MAENEMKWYVMRAISGKEGKVKEYVDAQVAQGDYGDKVAQVLIPTEKVVSIRNGKRYVKERCHLPGYVLVEANLVGEVQAMLRNTPNVLGFLGESKASTKPMPIRESEMKRLLGVVDEMADVPEDIQIPYLVGDAVKVADGEIAPEVLTAIGMALYLSTNLHDEESNVITIDRRVTSWNDKNYGVRHWKR